MIRFKEASEEAGIVFKGESYGASFGDFNNDGFVDLWAANHHDPPALYQNNQDGTFTNIAPDVFIDNLNSDAHGSAWADFDNDGDQDLVQLIGGGFGDLSLLNAPRFFSQFFVNNNGKLDNQADVFGLELPGGRGRSPLWNDVNNDGRLDLVITNAAKDNDFSSAEEQLPTTVLLQTDNGFEDAKELAGLDLDNSRNALLSDVNEDQRLDLIFPFSRRIYDTSKIPFQDISEFFGNAVRSRDVASADLNGDLKPDFYLAREQISSDITQRSPKELFGVLRGGIDVARAYGFSFRSEGSKVTLQFRRTHPIPFDLRPKDIILGAGGVNPRKNELDSSGPIVNIELSPKDRRLFGISPRGKKRGIYIGYDKSLKRWQVFWNFGSNPRPGEGELGRDLSQLVVRTRSNQKITKLETLNFESDPNKGNDVLLLSSPDGYVTDFNPGFNELPNQSSSVVLGDYDNDTDVDAYVVTTGRAANRPNRLYENLGDGTFRNVPGAGGATGTKLGIGESVVSGDYDNDGFLDLFVTNGRNILSAWFHRNSSPSELFRNQGNGNHWAAFQLEGTVSNRDAIGATVYLTADGKTQMREQSGGMHLVSQNQTRIHFGLGQSTVIEELKILWPSNITQVLRNLSVDQILTIQEGVGLDGNDLIQNSLESQTPVQFSGAEGNDTLLGGNHDDQLIGGSGRDILSGRKGDDLLTGGKGFDRLRGSSGKDTFNYNTPDEGGDIIRDFKSGQDIIQIDGSRFSGTLALGSLRDFQFVLGTRAQDVNDRFIYDRGSGNLWFDRDGNRGSRRQLLATLETSPVFRATDIQIV